MLKMKSLVVLCIVFFIATLGFADKYAQGETLFKIDKGMNTTEIGKRLEDLSVINNWRYFKIWAKLKDVEGRLQAGVYNLKKNLSINSAVNALTYGKSFLIKVTIPEGFSADQIADRLSARGIGRYEVFKEIITENNLEGYLYPETYYFNPGSDEKIVLDTMNRQFHKEIGPLLNGYDYSKFSKKYKFGAEEAIIMASLIEKEARIPEERARVSAVFHNRLKKRWYIESCATIRYILGNNKKRLLNKDLKIKSPYNTYINMGLPPGPICSPGKKSIEAALYPSNEDIMFFVKDSSDEGEHVFSRYYNDHIRAKKKRIENIANK
ncbi:MAG: endolytic transglycosylase MltG [Elusimicrobiota bacterium]